MSQLRATGVSVRHGDLVALEGVDLLAEPGTFVALTGPSGSGKTTLLWTLAGALRPTAGEVRFNRVLLSGREQAAAMGIVLIPQGNGLVSSLTGVENIVAPLVAAGVPAAQARDRADEALGGVGLPEHGSHLVEELSGGQQQRIAIARALAAAPRVLLADEPTSDLDAVNRERMMLTLSAEAARGAIVVMTTNDLEAAEHAHTRLVLSDGTISVIAPVTRGRPIG